MAINQCMPLLPRLLSLPLLLLLLLLASCAPLPARNLLAMSSTLPLADIIGDYRVFLDKVFAKALASGIDINGYSQIDHICYRTSSVDEYKSVLKELTGTAPVLGFLLVESMIGGRPIAIVELHDAIYYGNKYSIKHIEVPSPKAGSAYESGLEHLEVVLGQPGQRSPVDSKAALLAFAQQMQARNPLLQLCFKAADKHINADVSLDLDEHTAIKFHMCPIDEVIMLEREMNLVEEVPPHLSVA